ncbi:MAG: nucleotidyltransferase domain-containing protein [Chloroflexi bacterium]|nr:nucleotidyltransferase domain-containing protein [Chloroflexota bacterium]
MLEQALQVIRETLRRHNVRAIQCFLFGSRARGDFHPDSDWDIFVLVDRDLAFSEQRRLVTEIRRTLARLRIPNDIVIRSEAQFNALKDSPGLLYYDVAREGVPV